MPGEKGSFEGDGESGHWDPELSSLHIKVKMFSSGLPSLEKAMGGYTFLKGVHAIFSEAMGQGWKLSKPNKKIIKDGYWNETLVNEALKHLGHG